MRISAKNIFLLCVPFLIAGWIFFLRGPGFGVVVWNVDEAIHATAARTLLDGGVLYRDAIDQRTPLTYYAVAGLFAICGENNIQALHAATAGIIALTAFGLFLLGRRWLGSAGGWWAAAGFCALSTNLIDPGDAFAANTEWAMILFTTWAAWGFWQNQERPAMWRSLAVGAGFGCAFLSKQPGLLDFGAPLVTILFLWRTQRLTGIAAAKTVLGLVAGFVAVTALTLAYFAWRGALADFYQYAWVYNLVYYGPEISLVDRGWAFAGIVPMLWQNYSIVLLATALTVLGLAVGLVQCRPTAEQMKSAPTAWYLLAWLGLSLGGAAASGRAYGHYYIQCLPPLALAAAWAFTEAMAWWRERGFSWRRLAAAALLFAGAANLVFTPVRGRATPATTEDPALRSAAYIRKMTAPDERIFVWGYNPDIYLYADRKAASRFLYCSFLTGLVPWTNVAPEIDTRYAIVPGTMETLLTELKANRPAMLVDCSAGPHRRFSKYPLAHYPKLYSWVNAHYVLADPAQFVPQGFRLYLIKDSARRQPIALAGSPAGAPAPVAGIYGPQQVDPTATEYTITGSQLMGGVQRLELLVDGTPVDAVSFNATPDAKVKMSVPFDQLGAGQYGLTVRVTSADGATATSAILAVECGASALAAGQSAAFALPHLATSVAPDKVRAPYGAEARMEAGHLVFFAHAPSALIYALPDGASRVSGRFGFRPGAWAASNPGRTDGADFSISLVSPGGTRQVLFDRTLRPVEQHGDRGEQEFTVSLPTGARGQLEFAIAIGAGGNASSDWTYWSDLLLVSSR